MRAGDRGDTYGVDLSPEPDDGQKLRASDDDRRRAAEVLRQHCDAGRLDLDEYSERLGRAYSARTLPELFALTADLPHPDAVVPVASVGRAGTRGGRRDQRGRVYPTARLGGLRWAPVGFLVALAALVAVVYGPSYWLVWVFWVIVALAVAIFATRVVTRARAGRK